MTALQAIPIASSQRKWIASLQLNVALRATKTVLTHNQHYGPLRVQRPFYPEPNGCCHIYLLHPPGGLVLGDLLDISIGAQPAAHALVTTPSAGKLYGVQSFTERQRQHVKIQVEDAALMEWLPQETIVFDGANGCLDTHIDLVGTARAAAWDIVCLGRPAAKETFVSGSCRQNLTVRRNGAPLLVERNQFQGSSEMLTAPWGLNGASTLGTFILTLTSEQSQLDFLRQGLTELSMQEAAQTHPHRWGVTQKGELLIVRYLGPSTRICRKGFEWAWHYLRPQLRAHLEPVTPRIWNT